MQTLLRWHAMPPAHEQPPHLRLALCSTSQSSDTHLLGAIMVDIQRSAEVIKT